MRHWIVRGALQYFGHYIHLEYKAIPDWENGPRIFVFNHSTTFEVIPVAAVLLDKCRDRVAFMVDWMYGILPLSGWILSLIETIYIYNKPAKYGLFEPIRQKGIREQTFDNTMRYFDSGYNISLFPEGTRNKSPQILKRGRRGVGFLALHSEKEVQPIGIDFPKRMRNGKIPKLDHIIMRIGRSLDFSDEIRILKAIQDTPDLEARTQRRFTHYLYDVTTFKIMQALSPLCRKQYPYTEPRIPEGFSRFAPHY